MATGLNRAYIRPVADALYNRDILRLAASIPHLRRLDAPQASAARRSPVCGRVVTVDIVVDEQGRVAALGQAVSACALGQASAALMAAHAVGVFAEFALHLLKAVEHRARMVQQGFAGRRKIDPAPVAGEEGGALGGFEP